jgi:hypothetical protein
VEFIPRLISLHSNYMPDYQLLLIDSAYFLLLEQFFQLVEQNNYKLSII